MEKNKIKNFDDFLEFIKENNSYSRISMFDTKEGIEGQFQAQLKEGKSEIKIMYCTEDERFRNTNIKDVGMGVAFFSRDRMLISI